MFVWSLHTLPVFYEQMEVGLAAAKAMKSVHGMDYEVGNSAAILC